MMFILLQILQQSVSEDGDDIIIRNSHTKSCLLDPWPPFLIRECSDILLTLITKLVNCSFMEERVSDGFKSARINNEIWNSCPLILHLEGITNES